MKFKIILNKNTTIEELTKIENSLEDIFNLQYDRQGGSFIASDIFPQDNTITFSGLISEIDTLNDKLINKIDFHTIQIV